MLGTGQGVAASPDGAYIYFFGGGNTGARRCALLLVTELRPGCDWAAPVGMGRAVAWLSSVVVLALLSRSDTGSGRLMMIYGFRKVI